MPDTDHPRLEDQPEPDALAPPFWDDTADDSGALLRPAWDDLPDETVSPPPHRPRSSAVSRDLGDTKALLAPLAAAQDSLSRLDARAEAAPALVRTGLIARLALREAAGWLAAQNAWVHPCDLALRTGNLAGRFDTAAQIARPNQALPSTLAAEPGGWDNPEDLAALAQRERAVTQSLALARLLAALPRRHDPLATADSAAALLTPLGAGGLDANRFAAWRAAYLPPPGRKQSSSPTLPPLLHAGEAALGWMESGATDEPDAIVALAIGALRLVHSEALRSVPLPFWAAWPALGHPTDGGLPRLRPALARELAGADRAPWSFTFLAFAAEAARAGLRELDRLVAAAETGWKMAAGLDRRSRLPAVVELALTSPVVTSREVARKLGITLQAANRILSTLEGGGMVKEVTGRGSFRAFGI